MGIFDRLDDFAPFELWMPEVSGPALAGLPVNGAELPGCGTGEEILLRRSYRVQ
jgi:hypothetical protein